MFFLLKIISRFPLRLLYVFSSVLSVPLSIFYRKKQVMMNLRSVFPERSEEELKKIAKAFYRNFSDVMVEVVKAATIPEKDLARRIRFANPEISFAQQEKDQPLLLFALHQCNWEWMALASRSQASRASNPVYKPLEDAKADAFMYNMRSRFGGTPLSKETAAREIIRKRNEHCIIGLVADQSPPRNAVYWAHLFGRETDFYPGLVQLPYLMQAPAYFCHMVRVKRGYYDVKFILIGKPPYKKNDYTVLQRYIEEVERLVSEHPEDYLWTHNRWKHTRREDEELIRF